MEKISLNMILERRREVVFGSPKKGERGPDKWCDKCKAYRSTRYSETSGGGLRLAFETHYMPDTTYCLNSQEYVYR